MTYRSPEHSPNLYALIAFCLTGAALGLVEIDWPALLGYARWLIGGGVR